MLLLIAYRDSEPNNGYDNITIANTDILNGNHNNNNFVNNSDAKIIQILMVILLKIIGKSEKK